MATFTVLDSISRSNTFPITYDYSAEYNCGTLSLEISSEWSNQMLLELPCINFKILKSDGTLFRTFSINMSTVNTDLNTGISAEKPYIIPFYDIPKSGSFHITPMFDKNAIAAHNEMERNGIVNSINTTNKGVVTADDIDIWTSTDVFDITIEFSNDNISSGGAGGGGGDTPTLIDKNITANGTYLASDDDADGYSSVAVDVPNSYTAGDEGKVVNNGTLVAQTAMPSEVTENGTVDTTLYNSVTVNVPSGGGGSESRKDVNFYDYDGTIVYSYTATEFANLNAMPENPAHDGLTAQGWNWSLQDAKTYVASYGKLEIGQMYVTSDGKTRFYITLTEGRISPILKLTLASGSEVDVDWGDGTAHETLSGSGDMTTNRHEYASAGSYVISITVSNGSITIPQYVLSNGDSSTSSPDKTYMNAIKKVEIGSSVTSIGTYAFQGCSSLTSITIPSSVTSIGSYAFTACQSLPFITIPSSVDSINDNTFNACSSFTSITIPSSVKTIGNNAFSQCPSLTSITIPSRVTSIGGNAFLYGYSLTSITIPSSVTSIGASAFNTCSSFTSITIPSSVKTIGASAFSQCSSLTSITIPGSVTSIGDNAFRQCYSLSSITILSGVTSIGANVFSVCSSLTSITIPSSVTSIGSYAISTCQALSSITIPSSVKTIGDNAFNACSSLSSITIPSSVTSIGANAFKNCYSLATITILGKSSGDISGAPWGANTSSPTNTQIIWENDQ